MILVPVGLGPKLYPGDISKRTGLVQDRTQKGNALGLTIKFSHIINVEIFLKSLVNVLPQTVSNACFGPGILTVKGLPSVQQKPTHFTDIQENGGLGVLQITPECVY